MHDIPIPSEQSDGAALMTSAIDSRRSCILACLSNIPRVDRCSFESGLPSVHYMFSHWMMALGIRLGDSLPFIRILPTLTIGVALTSHRFDFRLSFLTCSHAFRSKVQIMSALKKINLSMEVFYLRSSRTFSLLISSYSIPVVYRPYQICICDSRNLCVCVCRRRRRFPAFAIFLSSLQRKNISLQLSYLFIDQKR